MVLIFTVKEKVFLNETFTRLNDPLGGSEGVEIAIMQRYICLFGIAYAGTRKMAKAYSIGTGQHIPVLLWTEPMKNQADDMISCVSGAWKNRIVGQVVLLAVATFISWLFVIAIMNVRDNARQAEYVQNPAVGDIILARVTFSHNINKNMPSSLKVLCIRDVQGDSLVIVRGYQSEDPMEQYRIKNKNKLIKLFDMSENAFANTREVYSLTQYQRGDKRLRRIYREGLTGDESHRQDSILNHTDIIEPLYVKRIKNS